MPRLINLASLKWKVVLLAMLATVWMPMNALAHHLPPGMEDVDEFEDGAAFLAGLRHPLLGMDHWLFAVVVGALVGWVVSRGRWVLPACFAGGLSAGMLLGLKGMLIAGSAWCAPVALLAGLALVAMRPRLPVAPQAGLVAAVALWQGNAHGLAWPVEAGGAGYGAGVVLASLLLAAGGATVVGFARRAGATRGVSSQVS